MVGFSELERYAKIFVIFFAICMTLTLCIGGRWRSAEVRYRVTASVDDNGVTRSASSVWRLRLSPGGIDTPFHPSFYGEAIPIILPNRGMLLFLAGDVEGANVAELLPEHLFGGNMGNNRVQEIAAIARHPGLSRNMACDFNAPKTPDVFMSRDDQECLALAALPKPEDSASFEPIEQGSLANYYPGLRVNFVNVTITDEPVTKNISSMISWMRGPQAPDPHRMMKYPLPKSGARSEEALYIRSDW